LHLWLVDQSLASLMPSTFRKILSPSFLAAILKPRMSVATATLAFVLAVCGTVIGLEVSHILQERARTIESGNRNAGNLVKSLVQHAEVTVRAADAVLTSLVEQLERGDFRGETGRERLMSWFERQVEQIAQFQGFAIVDDEGRLIASSPRDGSGLDNSDREYYRYHLTHDGKQLHINAPVRGHDRWDIPVSRRFSKSDGSFAGVVLVRIRTDYFQKLYDQLDLGNNGAVLLASADGKLLVRRPFEAANVGKDLLQSGLFRQLQTSKAGAVEIKSSTDGVVRQNSYQQSELYPLVLAVANSTEEMLTPWRERAAGEVLATAAIVLTVASLGFFLRRIAVRKAELHRMFEVALGNMPNGLCMFDAEMRMAISNARYCEIYGLTDEEVRPGTPLRKILETHLRKGDTNDPGIDDHIDACLNLPTQTHLLQDGRTVFIRRNKIPEGGWIATHEDITELKRHQDMLVAKTNELEQMNARFEAAINNMSLGVCVFDADQKLVVSNRRYGEVYHLSLDQVMPGTSLREVLENRRRQGTDYNVSADDFIGHHIQESVKVQELADGRLVSVAVHPMPDGGWLATHEDITDRAKGERKIAYLAQHDLLTGLPNRAYFTQLLEGPVKQRGDRVANNFAVFMLDLDKFKQVNDTLGHAAGDQLLCDVAGRLKAAIRDTDVLARLGGDEFAIIQPLEDAEHEAAIALALRILQAIERPFSVDGHDINVGTSIGIALAPQDGDDPKDLLKKADLALYAAKGEGRNDFRMFQPEMVKAADIQKALENDLRKAIGANEFELHYQPIINVRTQGVCGAEALVRWRHPQRGLISPDQFIPAAEASGLIVPLGDWILQQACNDAATWPAHLRVAVNLSAVQFNKGNLFDVVLCALVVSGLSPDRLELEITESALLEKEAAHLQTIRQLKNLGITIALDDFGTGYSSASYVTRFPFDRIKIDKSFTQGAAERRDCAAVIASVLALARGLDIDVTAEGIETEKQFQMVRNAGVECAQGYLFGAPVPLSRFVNENLGLSRRAAENRAAS
jgi:diguanylate cyclase (GGDEF)-like protein